MDPGLGLTPMGGDSGSEGNGSSYETGVEPRQRQGRQGQGYGKPDYQASEMVIGEPGRVMGIKNDT